MYIDKNKFGGNVYQQDLNNIFLNNSKRYNLCYSHKKENRWNLWVQDSDLTLSFVLNNGLFIPSLSGIERKTLDKFYSSSPADVYDSVQHCIGIYFKTLKSKLEEVKEDLTREHRDEHEEFLTQEEIASMYPEPIVEETKKFVPTRKRKKVKNSQVPGQLSLFDLYGDD